ncbi:hypothetical protein IFM89_010191 [Coptis chinensis]|uniref:E2 ubiquitin-conjugating enzyme n=1 Tax=Coptis chinensis TaxID=261450 RepID=A0A835GYW7_9MAGN|nr:hypothetical protein IFM89_010191 [Coptis chinensis]
MEIDTSQSSSTPKTLIHEVQDALAEDLMASPAVLESTVDVSMSPMKNSGSGSGSENLDDQNDYNSDSSYFDDNLSYYDEDFAFDNDNDDNDINLQAQFDAVDLPTGVELQLPWLEQPAKSLKPAAMSSSTVPNPLSSHTNKEKKENLNACMQQSLEDQMQQAGTSSVTALSQSSSCIEKQNPASSNSTLSGQTDTRSENEEKNDVDILEKYRLFKQFDTVQDYSDHHFSRGDSKSKQAPQKWTKTIQQEWKILEKDLPDTIFVRVYEERMDLLRAVIIGTPGTPYHDGLFFFDILFPSAYPDVPPYYEDFVMGHFLLRAHVILEACKAYMEGAQVGFSSGAGQDMAKHVVASKNLKAEVSAILPRMVQAFSRNGAKDYYRVGFTVQTFETVTRTQETRGRRPFQRFDIMDDDDEVVEIKGSDYPTFKKRRRSKVVPHDVIEIDDDPAGVVIIGEKGGTRNKGKDIITGYNNNWANQEALAQDFTVPASATELGSMNYIPMNHLSSSGLGFNNLNNLNGGSLHYGFSDFPNYYNDASYYDGTTSFQTSYAMDFPLGLGATALSYPSPPISSPWFEQPAAIHSKPVSYSSPSIPNLLSSSWDKEMKDGLWLQQPANSQKEPASRSSVSFPVLSSCTREMEEDKDEVLKKYRLFKQFDTVGDYSDHHYASQGSKTKQPPRNWAKAIQQEWKILEKDLPDTIFVRVYEERMDLLRAVIVGAAGTPYHDGLFFFDFCFTSGYPNVPPQVYYHSGGLRLNPNLYNCGKVCLSLLNTWQGSKEEKWIPRKSTVLQVLLSIQALVLNAKPFYNEPGHASMYGGKQGEKMAKDYSENTYILSCRTMLYTLRRPPKHFEEYVAGHFHQHAHAILVACKAYMDGAQVGCLVGGGVQDVDEGDESCSQNFKTQVSSIVHSLVHAFNSNGSKDCKQFLPQTSNSRSMAETRQRAYGSR